VKGNVALVTGGGSGIGAATVAALRSRGATVIAADLRAGDGVTVLDVTDEGAVDALVAGIVAEHGRLDLAANVAGVAGTYAEVAGSTTDVWRHTMAVNLDGAYFCVRAELRAMLAAGAGAIVNVASSAARMGVPGLAAYSASKHGVLGLTRTAALEVARAGIRVNAVCPGAVRTPMLAGFVGGDADALEAMGRRAPMGRLGAPAEVAEAAIG
jgi:NAD(P)-dependent dehydrogenase (short-subunit alcohol dehydrogenase family)